MESGASGLRVTRFDDPAAFKARAFARLLEDEAQNCVIFGVLARLTEAALRRKDESPPLMLAVEDVDGCVVSVGTMTSPFPIVLSPSPAPAAAAMGEWIVRNAIPLGGVTGEAATAQAFAAAWSRCTGGATRSDTRLGVYQIEQTIPPRAVEGSFRQALTSDMDALLPFAQMFFREIREPLAEANLYLGRAIDEERLFVWCDPPDRIVSMAAFAGPTPSGVRVNFVCTPPALRGRGYASNCVAALTTRLLQTPGRTRVFLFTDLSNPTSNRIYQAIGYRYLGEQHKILFMGATCA
jgi:predicted GNAT family acetyltransferase